MINEKAVIYTRSGSVPSLEVSIIKMFDFGILYNIGSTKVFIPYTNIDRIEYV